MSTVAAIGIEPLAGKIRLLANGAEQGEHPAFLGACNTQHLSPTELIISALSCSNLTRAHLRLIARWSYDAGYRWIYAKRPPGHTLPFATLRTTRPLKGWYEVDLERVIAHMSSGAGNA